MELRFVDVCNAEDTPLKVLRPVETHRKRFDDPQEHQVFFHKMDVLAVQASHHDWQHIRHLSDQVPRNNIDQHRQYFARASVGSNSLVSPNILSASRYDDIGNRGLSDSKAVSVQLYGGLLTDGLPCTDSGYKHLHSKARHQKLHASAMQPDNRKSDSNRQRGRPRLSISNETPAEKRRTQIRVAQRKYRQRKENTITELKAEVSELHYMLDAMNDSFLRLHEGLCQTELLATLPSNHRLLCHLQFMRKQSAHISNILRDTGSDASVSPDN